MMYSSTDELLGTLAREMPRGQAADFLRGLLNLRDGDTDSVSRFCERFAEFIPRPIDWRKESAPALMALAPVGKGVEKIKIGRAQETREVIKHVKRHIGDLNLMQLWHWKIFLEQAWKQPTTVGREIAMLRPLYLVLEDFYKLSIAVSAKGSSLGPARAAYGNLVVAIAHAWRIASYMRYCANPTCPAPYFVARRRSQKYCGPDCTAPAQREFKAAWWREHGEKWRAGRAARKRRGEKARRKGGN